MERPPCSQHHLVEFYETEAFLVATVTDFLVPALHESDAVLVVATPEHRDAFDAAIRERGIDLDAARRNGRYEAHDARELLAAFMVDGKPDRVRFQQLAGGLVDGACEHGGHVWIYGEMVALLCSDGDAPAALALEDLWNELGSTRDFSLLCAYPLRVFDVGARSAFRRICKQHTTVIPAEDYTLAPTADRQQRVVAELQQENAALRAELRRRRRAGLAAGSVLALTSR
jgi:hypothetical protein